MADNNQLTTAWLAQLTNPHHDGTTQQIDDFVSAYVTDNARFSEKAQALHQCRQKEDEVWMKAQRDPAVKRLEEADKQQDGYVSAARYINLGHAGLPDGEPTKQEAKAVEQVFKDYSFSTKDAYGAESDKIIQMQQNLQQHESHLMAIGAWPFYLKGRGEGSPGAPDPGRARTDEGRVREGRDEGRTPRHRRGHRRTLQGDNGHGRAVAVGRADGSGDAVEGYRVVCQAVLYQQRLVVERQ